MYVALWASMICLLSCSAVSQTAATNDKIKWESWIELAFFSDLNLWKEFRIQLSKTDPRKEALETYVIKDSVTVGKILSWSNNIDTMDVACDPLRPILVILKVRSDNYYAVVATISGNSCTICKGSVYVSNTKKELQRLIDLLPEQLAREILAICNPAQDMK
ncbi:MAG: hypothetical protein D8M52_09200 [Chlorobi bacterium]|nr:hypothetical protein [Chlorobiota bacterium]